MTNSLCRHEGCTKHAQKMGVCVTHGAIIVRKLCSHEGCAKKSQSSGLCITHGARVKRRIKGCYNNNIKGGHCITHRAKVRVRKPRVWKQCSHDRCNKKVQKNGLCWRHGHSTASSESAHMISMPPCGNAVTNKGCDDLNDDIMHMNVITITSTEGGREVNLRILSL